MREDIEQSWPGRRVMLKFDDRGFPQGIVSADLSLVWVVVSAARDGNSWKATTLGSVPNQVILSKDGGDWLMRPDEAFRRW